MAITQTQFEDMMARNLTPFRQDVVGDNSIEITADTEARYVVDGDTRNSSTGPAYFTDRWDTTNNKMTAITEYDGPTYVADLGFVWTPDSSNAGTMTIRVYIDDASPKLIRTYTMSYKGASVTVNTLATWYWGSETGYDAKNDGIYFTLEFEHDGDVTAPSVIIYNTQ